MAVKQNAERMAKRDIRSAQLRDQSQMQARTAAKIASSNRVLAVTRKSPPENCELTRSKEISEGVRKRQISRYTAIAKAMAGRKSLVRSLSREKIKKRIERLSATIPNALDKATAAAVITAIAKRRGVGFAV